MATPLTRAYDAPCSEIERAYEAANLRSTGDIQNVLVCKFGGPEERMTERFDLGAVDVSPGTRETLSQCGQDLEVFVARHASGDWGHFGDFDLGPLADDRTRSRAILFLMLDSLFGGRDVAFLEFGDIDTAAGTVFGRHRGENRKLSEEGKAALTAWLDKSAITTGIVFPGLEPAALRDLFRAIQGSVSFANSVAVLLGRGPVDSVYFIERPSSSGGWFRKLLQLGRPRQQPTSLLVIRTSLDGPRQTTAELTDNAGILMQLSVIAAPNHMFGPERVPFERRRFIVQP